MAARRWMEINEIGMQIRGNYLQVPIKVQQNQPVELLCGFFYKILGNNYFKGNQIGGSIC